MASADPVARAAALSAAMSAGAINSSSAALAVTNSANSTERLPNDYSAHYFFVSDAFSAANTDVLASPPLNRALAKQHFGESLKPLQSHAKTATIF